ncbi:MAG: peptidase MA family metallohydrolase [Armatimonadota bacterium]
MTNRLLLPVITVNRIITSCLALLALLAPAQAYAYSRGAETSLSKTMKTEFFTVHYDPADPYLPQLMSETARIALIRISHDLGYEPEKNRPFVLNIYPTHNSFIEAGGLKDSKFTVGTASSREVISVDASGVFASPTDTINHEITHMVIFRILCRNVSRFPLWANEGLAQYESEEFPDADNTLVANAAADGALIPLSYFVDRFPKDKSDLAYAESASAIRFMVKKHGKSSPKTMLRELTLTGSFDKAMLKATGQTANTFTDSWEAHVTKRYYALKLTRIAMGVIPVVMAILAIIAFFVRRKQKIEAARQWEQEEFDEAMRRQLGNDWWR